MPGRSNERRVANSNGSAEQVLRGHIAATLRVGLAAVKRRPAPHQAKVGAG